MHVWKTIVFELKSLRLYWFPILTMTIVVPLSYFLIVVLSSGSSTQNLLITLPGFMVISVFSVLVLPLAQKINNMFSDDVIELIASLPISLKSLILAYIGTYTMLSLPLITVPVIVLVFYLQRGVNMILLVFGLTTLWYLALALSILLGLTVRNKLKLDPLLSILLLTVIILTPAFYPISNVTGLFRSIVLVNPLTHIVLILRASVGVYSGIPLTISFTYLALLLTIVTMVLVVKVRNIALNIIEKR